MNGIVDCVRPSTLPPVNAKHRIYHNGGTQSLGGDKWKDLDRKAKKLHRKLAAIDSRYN
eukprot:COSAG01_NODE_22354_length_859_cov_1.273684_2_plen_58_part_01